MLWGSIALKSNVRGPEDKFDAKFVKQMLKDYDLELDGFTAGDLLRVWRKY